MPAYNLPPDLLRDINDLRKRVAILEGAQRFQSIIQHLTADPASPANGTIWIRDDSPLQLRARSGGATYQTQLGGMVAYTPALGNITAGTVNGWYAQLGPIGIVHIRSTSCTATAAGYTTYSLPFQQINANSPALASLGFTAPFKPVAARVGALATTVTVAADLTDAQFTTGALCDISLWAWVHMF